MRTTLLPVTQSHMTSLTSPRHSYTLGVCHRGIKRNPNFISITITHACMLSVVIILRDCLVIPFLILVKILMFTNATTKTQTDVYMVVFKLDTHLKKFDLVHTLCHSSHIPFCSRKNLFVPK
jgi:hypothetical protein